LIKQKTWYMQKTRNQNGAYEERGEYPVMVPLHQDQIPFEQEHEYNSARGCYPVQGNASHFMFSPHDPDLP